LNTSSVWVNIIKNKVSPIFDCKLNLTKISGNGNTLEEPSDTNLQNAGTSFREISLNEILYAGK
jgi:hypothetical protein